MDIPLFHVALELEREGFKLFNELSHQTKEESGWKMFLQMLEMEQGHRELLEGSIAYLEDPERVHTERWRPSDAA